MVSFDVTACHVATRCGERGSGECDCGERRDEFHLVHGVVPFFACGYVFQLDGRSNETANESAEE